MIGWCAVVFSIQSWLNESPNSANQTKQPALFGIAVALMSLGIVGNP